MNDYYSDPRALRATEDRLQAMSKELLEAKEKIDRMYGDYDAAILRSKIASIQTYDETVQQIIAASPILQEAWDNFRVQYQLTASKELLQTAREKISGKAKGICYGCNRSL
jgi:hypothetical protein